MAIGREESSGLCGKKQKERSRREELVRFPSLNVNGLNAQEKRKEVIGMCEERRIDVSGMSETHLRGYGVVDGRDETEGGAVGGLRGMSDMGRGRKRKREVCPNGLPVSVGRYGWAATRTVWMMRKIEMIKCV